MRLPLGAELNLAGLSDEKVATYPWIIAYGMMQSTPAKIIRSDLVRAIQVGAPSSVICHNGNGVWTTLGSIPAEHHETRLWLLDWAWSRDMTLPYETLKVWLDPNLNLYLDQAWAEP